MSAEGTPRDEQDVMSWDQFVTYLEQDGIPEDVSRLLRSDALRDAMDGPDEELSDSVARVMMISMLLMNTRIAVRQGVDGAQLADAIDQQDRIRTGAVAQLRSAAASLRPDLRGDVMKIAEKAMADRFSGPTIELLSLTHGTSRLGRRGRASADPFAAFVAWTIRELDELVKPTARNRYATISALLGLANIVRSPVQVRAILKRGKT